MDFFSEATCHIKAQDLSVKGRLILLSRQLYASLTLALAAECVSDHGKAACTDLGGECITERDGYYIVSGICLALGVLSVTFHMLPTARKLQGM